MRKKVHAVQHSFVDTRTGMASTQPGFQHIREQVELGSVEIFYVATKDQVADALTKNVPISVMERFRQGVGLVPSAS